MFLEVKNRHHGGSQDCPHGGKLKVQVKRRVRTMFRKLKPDTKMLEEREKVLVPVRRREAEKEAE